MGGYFSALLQRLWGEREYRILILGLDGAGKTTILYRLQLGTIVETVPTVGFNVESLTYQNLTFQVWDLGGQTSIRPYWRCYYADTDAVIYVIDSSDPARLGMSKTELMAMLEEEELSEARLVVFANKCDVEGSVSASVVAERLGLGGLRNRSWQIFRCSAVTGEGLREGLDWLVNGLREGR